MQPIGYTSYYGFTPAIDVFRGTGLDVKSDEPLNVLISDACDIRHVIKTISDHGGTIDRQAPINVSSV